ncbi:uncharacterized protein LOC111175073 [Delphinapterus leucas]|uniref:Uncharacterized protein LOC111175073 n=1 Tax=Delphinapterus leucas TaxID=9749 RepID=A0A7F8KDL5_DELLE|nr:uncharacterized protein LOC111175073 [Delphinapterus leucas]
MVTPAPPPAAGLPRSERVQHRGPRGESEKSRSEICRGRAPPGSLHGRDGRPESPGPGSAGVALLLTRPAERRTDRRRGPFTLPGCATVSLLPVECGGDSGSCSNYAAARLTGSAAVPRPGPKPGRAGAGDAQRSGGAGWAGGRRRPRCILLNRPLSTLPTISLQRNVGKSVGFVLFSLRRVESSGPGASRTRPPGAGALTVKSARTTQSLQLPRREPTCPQPPAEPLRLDVDGGQLSSPAATSRNGSAEVLRSENGRRERTKALGCSPAPLPDVPLGRLPRASINPPHLSPSGLQVQDVLPRSVGQKGNYYVILDRKTEGWFPLINSQTQTDKAWGSRVEKGAECLHLDRKANHVCPSLISSQGYSVSRKLWKHSGSLIDHSSCFIKYAVMLALPAKYDKMKSPMALPRKAENQQSTTN